MVVSNHKKNSTSAVPPSLNPFPLLLTSRCTRSSPTTPHPITPIKNDTTDDNTTPTTPNNNNSDIPSYLILLQHSLSLTQRVISSMPLLPSKSKEKKMYQRANIFEPVLMANRDSVGFLLLKETFDILCVKHGGGLVLVSVAGNSMIGNNDDAGGSSTVSYDMWRNYGANVDLCSDPMGWDDDDEGGGKKEPMSGMDNEQMFSIQSRMDDLEAVAQAIENAASTVVQRAYDQRNNNNSVAGTECDDISNDDEEEQNDEPPSSSSSSSVVPSSVPIVFDSLTPLISMHGVHNTILLLERLRRGHCSSSCRPSEPQTVKMPMLSPIIAPTLKEMLNPNHHRMLEDTSDAVVTLSGGELGIVRKSLYTGKVTKENQPFSIQTASVQDGQKRQTLTFSPYPNDDDDDDDDEVSTKEKKGDLHNKAAAKEDKNGTKQTPTQTNDDSSSSSFGDLTFKLGQLTTNEEKERASTVLPYHIPNKKSARPQPNNNNKKKPLVIQHETDRIGNHSEGSESQHNTSTSRSAPRIFLQDDDPDFDDLDEEDPDDDLDL